MYYKFSGFTQKLTGSAPLVAYAPQSPDKVYGRAASSHKLGQGFRPAVPSQSPTMVFATPTKVTSEVGRGAEYLGANRVPDLQKIFQGEGMPVHLKMGVPDKLLYRTTMALTIGGTLYCLMALYIATQPRK